jgi:N-acetylglucosaminyldiphosphoundecaprenol N-acetyl-beta-D-mannosaminyltransferase
MDPYSSQRRGGVIVPRSLDQNPTSPHGAAIVAGVAVDDVTMDDTIELVEAFVVTGRATGRSFQIATVNVDFVVNAQQHADLAAILRRAELCVPDGMPVVWHARLTGTPLRSRVAGADLVPALVARSVETGWRILLFGSAEGVAEAAAAQLIEQHPGAIVIGISGPMLPDPARMDQRWIDDIVGFDPDIICVALGNPKQERWIDAHRDRLGASVLIGVGGTLDFLVGGRRRAPEWMGRVGLEWLFRAAQEPRRLGRRYAHDAVVFGPHLLRAARRRVMSPARAPASDDVTSSTLTAVDLARITAAARHAHRRGERCAVPGLDEAARVLVAPFDPHGTIDGWAPPPT